MDNISYSEKIKLRNKYKSKIINKFNKSINLLNNFDKHLFLNKKGGAFGDGDDHLENFLKKDTEKKQITSITDIKDIPKILSIIELDNGMAEDASKELKEINEKLEKLYTNINQYIRDNKEHIDKLTGEVFKLEETNKLIYQKNQEMTTASLKLNTELLSIKEKLSNKDESVTEIEKENASLILKMEEQSKLLADMNSTLIKLLKDTNFKKVHEGLTKLNKNTQLFTDIIKDKKKLRDDDVGSESTRDTLDGDVEDDDEEGDEQRTGKELIQQSEVKKSEESNPLIRKEKLSKKELEEHNKEREQKFKSSGTSPLEHTDPRTIAKRASQLRK